MFKRTRICQREIIPDLEYF